MRIQSVLDTIRQPEYTGDNRCIPCTVVNIAIMVVICVVLAVWMWPVAIGFAVIALASIALRGYLVPGTPTLTKRYLPDRVLAVFDKGPTQTTAVDPDETAAVDAEQILLKSDAVEPCEDIDDICLTPSFRKAWYDRMDTIVEMETEREALAESLDTEGEIEFVDHGEAFAAHIDGRSVGQWESRAAFIADLAAARELSNWIDAWETLDVTEQGTVIRGLRVFVETCPSCDGPVVPSQETVESCCREHTVVAIACESCDARIFESTVDPAVEIGQPEAV